MSAGIDQLHFVWSVAAWPLVLVWGLVVGVVWSLLVAHGRRSASSARRPRRSR